MDAHAIAKAVLDVGFQDLTFATVADRLGISRATLFRHVPDRDELVRLGLDLAVRRWAWPSLHGPWQDVLERWAIASWRAWEAHPGAVIEVTRGIVPPSVIMLADEVGAVLLRAGFTPADAVLAVDLVFDLAADNRRGVETLDGRRSEHDARAIRDRLGEQWFSADADAGDFATGDERREIRAAMGTAIWVEPIDWFRGKLSVVLAGIERQLAPGSGPAENTGER